MKNKHATFTLDELCSLVGMNKRKVRFYMQNELVDRPEGSGGKGSFYTHRHLEQLLTIKKWKDAGLSLERIKEIIEDQGGPGSAAPLPPAKPRKPGAIEVWSHIHLADGIELQIEPERSRLSPEQLRRFSKTIMTALSEIRRSEDDH
ncbi:MAG: MerR family transcriptional regulator [Deltaproteobacteria bacterium]|nr:MerR family transcriptional regulator [Deltaproteobacteria bacterium]